ncbi:MAG: PepSY-associated TM helix domain-containing protein [Sphingomonas fennica]
MNDMSRHPVAVAAPPRTFVQRALAGHAALGLLASAILYLITLTGTLAVIHERWQAWEQPAVPTVTALSPTAVQAALAAIVARDAGKPATTHLYVALPTDELPRAIVTSDHGGAYVDAAGRIVADEANGWTELVTGLHEYLHMPMTAGMIAVGAFGAMLAALTVTGVLAHPRILRDAFRLRLRGDAQIGRVDLHNRLGVWTLPFALAVGLTGAFVGLGMVGATTIAQGHFGGDTMKVYAPIFGGEPTPNPAPAPLPDVAAALATLGRSQPQAVPTYVILHDPGTRGQHVQILAEHPRRLIYGESYFFDAAGRQTGKLGLADGAIGQQVTASVYRLHFGNYAGLAVRLAYLAMGAALCVVIATGTSIWLEKRRRRGHPSPRLAAAWAWAVWGTPIVLVGLLWARAASGDALPLPTLFWAAMAAGVALAVALPGMMRTARLAAVMAAMLAVTAIGHALLPGVDTAGRALDAALLASAAAIALYARRRRPA